MNYFDTSALIKRFVEERGSTRVDELVAADRFVATSKIAYAETHAGLARKFREGSLRQAAYRRVSRSFDQEWPAYLRVEVSDAVLVLSRDLVTRHPLRGFDAIHLASAIRLRDELRESVRMIAADEKLLSAAEREKLEAIDVQR